MPRRAVSQQVYRARPTRQPSRSTTSQRNPAAGTTYSGTVTNSGTVETAPTITVSGPAAAPFFENVTAGKTVWVNVAVPSGQDLVVDFATKTVTLNGVTQSNAVGVDSRWWTLAPGANTIRSNVAASVSHRDAFTG